MVLHRYSSDGKKGKIGLGFTGLSSVFLFCVRGGVVREWGLKVSILCFSQGRGHPDILHPSLSLSSVVLLHRVFFLWGRGWLVWINDSCFIWWSCICSMGDSGCSSSPLLLWFRALCGPVRDRVGIELMVRGLPITCPIVCAIPGNENSFSHQAVLF